VVFPCPGDEFAETLRRVNCPLLIQDPKKLSGGIDLLDAENGFDFNFYAIQLNLLHDL
jgi:hypothetical protein